MLALVVGSVWLVHGLYNKLLGGAPRHLAIVQSIPGLGGSLGEYALIAVGALEVAIALWVISGWTPHCCAATQTVALLSMNVVELTFARHHLLWPAGLIPVNLAFLGLAWIASEQGKPAGLRTRLRRHPIAIAAHFEECLTLTYALPPHVVRPWLGPGLELDTYRGSAFIAVALVQTRALRPAGVPSLFGRDFFLAGYRIFVKFKTPDGRTLRGLQILRSDANRRAMVIGGNLLTHYNYHDCEAVLDTRQGRIHATVDTPDRNGNIDLIADPSNPSLPADSPFPSWREARYFAGPMPYTFDYEQETHSIIAIKVTRANWKPRPVGIDVRQMSFFDQPGFRDSCPTLAGAFHVGDIDYRWERGVRYALDRAPLELQP